MWENASEPEPTGVVLLAHEANMLKDEARSDGFADFECLEHRGFRAFAYWGLGFRVRYRAPSLE